MTTIAHDVKVDLWFDLYPIDVEEASLIPLHVNGTSRGPIARYGRFESNICLRQFLDHALFQAFEDGKAQLICFGKVTYLDDFGDHHESGFRCTCRSDKPGVDGMPHMFSAPKGNYAN